MELWVQGQARLCWNGYSLKILSPKSPFSEELVALLPAVARATV